MVGTGTETLSYTTVDIGKVFDCFAAEFDMLAQSTGLRTRQDVRDVSEDVKTMAKHGHLKEVNIYLEDAAGTILRASKYEVSTDAALWTSQRPGNNHWSRLPGGRLKIHVIYSPVWWQLSAQQRQGFIAQRRCTWGTVDLDTSFPTLSPHYDRSFASNSYGLRKTAFH
jgi:hypothetical protein